jgi:hypothetical protein
MQRDRWLSCTAFVLLSALLVGTIWVVPYLPTNDGPQWIFAVHAENHYGDPGTLYRDIFVPTLQFASRGFTAICGPLEAWLGWRHGLQASLSVTVLLVAWGFVALVRALDPRRLALGYLGFPLALSWTFYMGLWAFVVSTAIGLFALALAVRLREPTWKGRALLSLALLVQAVAHVFGAVLTGAAILSLSLARTPRGRRLAELGRVALTGLPAMAVLAACWMVSRDLPHMALSQGFDRFGWLDTLAMLPRTVAPGPLVRATVVSLGVVAAVVVALARSRRDDTDAADRGLGVAAAIFLLAAALAPFQIPGWQAFSQRFVSIGVALAVAVLPIERLSPAWRRVASPALFAGAALFVALSYPFHLRLASLCPDAIAGLLAPVPIRGETFPVTLRGTELPTYDRIRSEVPLMTPLLHMSTAYAAAHGGVSTDTFSSSPAINLFQLRPRPSAPPQPDLEHYMRAMASDAFHHDLGFRREVEGELASVGVFYDEVVVLGALPEDLSVWRERGYVTDWAQGTALVAHFEPCTIDLTTPASAAEPGPTLDVRVGKIGLLAAVRVPGVVREDGLAHFELGRAPCGVVAVRARWEPTPGGAALSCRNADVEGDLVARITRSARRVVCEAR